MPGYAKSDAEAKERLLAYCDKIDLDPAWISDSKWDTTIRIARQKEYGWDEAENTIDSDKTEIAGAKAKEARQAKLDGDASNLMNTILATPALNNTPAHRMLVQCAAAYVGGIRTNLGYGSKMTRAAYATVRGQWTQISQQAGGGVYTAFVSHDPQDKAALGKIWVGDTLAVRGVQGNLLVRIGGMRFNMHVDITD
ncbi:hypothetical protein [Streptomyces sp. NPDC005485]|uniref:hypothetical protein n=1 Tax=Streptomyces sp. NPDC005485 TaxID=3155591 RepID=UPI0033B520D4